MKIGDCVKIEWRDACCYFGDVPEEWIIKRSEEGGHPVITVGILVKQNRQCIVVAQNEFEGGNVQQTMCIPRGMIKNIKVLEEQN